MFVRMNTYPVIIIIIIILIIIIIILVYWFMLGDNVGAIFPRHGEGGF